MGVETRAAACRANRTRCAVHSLPAKTHPKSRKRPRGRESVLAAKEGKVQVVDGD